MKTGNPPLKSVAVAVLIVFLSAVFSVPVTSGNEPRKAVKHVENPVAEPSDPEAIYEGARIVHNVMVDGQKGMRVHATFRVKYGLHVPCTLIAYFYYGGPQGK